MIEFFGAKVHAWFDVWSFEHFLSGISVGALVKRHVGAVGMSWTWLVLLLAFAWETFEHYLETGLAGATVQYWFQGVEFWGNRLVTDPILLLLGAMLCDAPWMIVSARVLSFLWLIVHVFVFRHSMYLHDLMGAP